MSNTSATGGFLTQNAGSGPVMGDALVDVFQACVAGITGLPGVSVRPAWQADPPQRLPDPSADWAAISVRRIAGNDNPSIIHDGAGNAGNGEDHLQRHERGTVLCSFYGPNSLDYATQLRDGLYIGQNRDTLAAVGVKLEWCGDTAQFGEQLNQRWYLRADLEVAFVRQVDRTYPILNVLSMTGEMKAEEQTRVTETTLTVEEDKTP